jgi:hypothetical protein
MSVMTELELQLENRRYCGTGGVSSHSRDAGFRPALMDSGTRAVYLSRFADGRMAPFHTLEGLPRELVLGRSASGRVAAIKPSVISGSSERACSTRVMRRPRSSRPIAGSVKPSTGCLPNEGGGMDTYKGVALGVECAWPPSADGRPYRAASKMRARILSAIVLAWTKLAVPSDGTIRRT